MRWWVDRERHEGDGGVFSVDPPVGEVHSRMPPGCCRTVQAVNCFIE
jgi:hypothetical protein